MEARERTRNHEGEEARPDSPAAAAAGLDSAPAAAGDWDGDERRSGDDRRYRPTSLLDSLLGRHRRRRAGRRAGEQQNNYVDVYHRQDAFLLLGIFVLNVFDAFFTLVWLQKGGTEGNPLMDALIQAGDGIFLLQKCFVVGVWLLVLMVHKNFRMARIGMWTLLGFYGAVLLYHFYLQLGPPPVVVRSAS